MSRLKAFAVALLVALMVAPAADAQIENPNASTPTTLYFHIFDTFNKFVVNTQPMNTQFFEVGGTNFPTLVGTPINQATGADYDLNTIYGTSTAGPVEYDFIENGKPRFHPERGIAADVDIDGAVEPITYMYIDVRDLVGLNGAPNALPDFTFRVTVREGDDPGPDAALDAGNLIMQGQVTGTLCSNGGDFEDVPLGDIPFQDACGPTFSAAGDVFLPDEDGIIELAIPMQVDNPRIPKADAFNVRLDWWQGDNMAGGVLISEDQFASGYLRLHASAEKQPRLEMAITNPVYIEFIHPQVAAGTLLIHTGVNSPWGTYDVDVDNITLTVTGPSQPQKLEQVVAQNQHVHGLHDQAAEVTYLWKFRDEGAANGQYTIRMEVQNDAKSSTAIGTAGFSIEGKRAFGVSDTGEVVPSTGDDGSEGSPGLATPIVLALLAVAFIAMRRWRQA